MNNLNLFRREFSTFKHLYRIYQPLKPLQKPNIILYNVRCLSVANKKGTHKPNTIEKYLLVWMKKYPSVAEVPSTVSADEMEKTRNWARIKINIILCIITAVVCVFNEY